MTEKNSKNTDRAASRRKKSFISLVMLQHLSTLEHVVVFFLIIIITSITLGWWLWEIPLVTPLDPSSSFSFLTGQTPKNTSDKVVYGFLPYWNIDNTTYQPELTHLGYFSLGIAADGSIVTRTDDGYLEPGYNKLQSDAFFDAVATSSAQPEIVFTQFYADTITDFLRSEKAQQNFLTSLDAILLAYPFAGVNIDIEYVGPVSDELRADYVSFIQLLDTHLNNTYQDIDLSIDLYASAASKRTIWDVAALEPYVDYYVVMAYDFHRSSSTVAGPVAPLFGGKKEWDSDISEHLQAFLDSVPSEKILLGIPFYGYEWQTTSREAQAHTFPESGSTASFKRVQNLLQEKETLKVQEHWNEAALSPYISYEEDGEIYVVYYENSRSISYKLDFVNQLDLAGVAIWALGYEGDSRELWDVINRKIAL
jgi:spore germination protein YaaH